MSDAEVMMTGLVAAATEVAFLSCLVAMIGFVTVNRVALDKNVIAHRHWCRVDHIAQFFVQFLERFPNSRNKMRNR